MRIRATRIGIASALSIAVMGLAGAPAAAESSLADRFLAAGGGTSFSEPIAASGFAASTCATDPTGDVVNLEDDEASIEEDRGDITDYCVTHGSVKTSLTLTVVEPTDPASDINWNASLIGWFIDTDGDGAGEFFVAGQLDDDGNMVGSVEDRSTTPASEVCEADFAYGSGTFSLTFDNSCLDAPEEISVNPGYIYDQRVGDEDGVAVMDDAPNGDGEFEGPVAPAPDQGVVRYAGGERIATAVAVAQAQYTDGGADTVILARQDLFPDAVAGTPLAVDLNAPILLTETDTLSELTEAEIARLTGGEGTVVLLGGELAISEDVELALSGAGYTVVRHGGSNRFETAVSIASALGSPDTILAADGGTYTYALMAGTAAPSVDGAVLLTDGSTVPPATQAYLDDTGADVTAIGTAASMALPDAESIAAADPIATAVDVAEAYYPNALVVGIARVDEFPDALAGGAYMASDAIGPGPILFTESDTLSGVVSDYISEQDPDAVIIFGGVAAISQDVEDEIAALL